jgi:hypothetical protein
MRESVTEFSFGVSVGVDRNAGVPADSAARPVQRRYIVGVIIAGPANALAMLLHPYGGFAVFGGLRYRM